MSALLVVLALALAPPSGDPDSFARGVEAYRHGDWKTAKSYWQETLGEELGARDRARVLYDLGNAAWRGGEALEAVGWYSASLRLEPRRGETWKNLELARAGAGLEPADRGDLRSTLRRMLRSLEPAERDLLVLGALVPCAILCTLEALRGGKVLARLLLASALVVVLAALPWALGLAGGVRDPMLVLRVPTVPLRSEPRADLPSIGEVAAGEECERLDALPGWTRVRSAGGLRGWVPEEALFALER